jgi:indole-3-glycerol phosphate synthase
MNNILAKILDQKAIEIASLDTKTLRRAAESSPAPRDFLSALKPLAQGGHPRLIAELKRASPSKGLLAPHLDLYEVAQIYAAGGAAAISVLTDEKFFMGKLETMRELRSIHDTPLPLLRKDFIIDESQIYEARANGADAILLIVAALPDFSHLSALHACARELNLTVLVEVHDEQEALTAQNINGLQLIGINNRNLVTFEVSLATTERIRPTINSGITVVAESGIFNAADVLRVASAHVDAILVGEALVTSGDIAAKVREISGTEVGA